MFQALALLLLSLLHLRGITTALMGGIHTSQFPDRKQLFTAFLGMSLSLCAQSVSNWSVWEAETKERASAGGKEIEACEEQRCPVPERDGRGMRGMEGCRQVEVLH